MPSKRSFFNSFPALFLILIHLGCFLFPAKTPPPKKRKLPTKPSPSPSHPSPAKAYTSLTLLNSLAYLKPIFSIKSRRQPKRSADPTPIPPPISTVPLSHPTLPSLPTTPCVVSRKRPSRSFCETEFPSDTLPKLSPFTIPSPIFPCPMCGEIFHNAPNLEIHQSAKHGVTELLEGDSAWNVVKLIFQTGWSRKERNGLPNIHRILKIHNTPKALSRFEEYRESVKIKSCSGVGGRWSERCVVDGNELLRFQCSTFICSLGRKGNSGVCEGEFCSVCGIIRRGFSPKLDGISTMGSSRRAHGSTPEEMEEEFAYMNVGRAMLVCRVVAGRVAREGEDAAAAADDKGSGGFDSLLVGRGEAHKGLSEGDGDEEEEELLVFNPRAVLPCFVIAYTV